MEGEPKVKNIVALADKVLPNTAPQGKDIIVRETDALKADWEAFVTALQKVRSLWLIRTAQQNPGGAKILSGRQVPSGC